ncbi:hypothetical protein [Colwellia sp. BRX8-9]|uniref:beta strand repeat-containing protein n=1 Tax=Colwellia sp. BRX8-9 TaxID=2759831 RepID=UPI0015F4E272|nr:hypothetical protein [Colwellia sp. BRX8-9]MBA6347181.1 hypothetical protein [Colwellia sp. BRX8-9]
MNKTLSILLLSSILYACGGSESTSKTEIIEQPQIATIDLSLGAIVDYFDDNSILYIPVVVTYSGTKSISHDVSSSNRGLVKTNYYNNQLTIDARDLVGEEFEIINVTYTISDGEVSDTKNFSFTLNNTSGACESDCETDEPTEPDPEPDPVPLVFTTYLERQSRMNEDSIVTMPFSFEYNGEGDVVINATLDVDSDIAEVSFDDSNIAVTSKKMKGTDGRTVNVTFTATAGEEVRTIVQAVTILNNIPDNFSISIKPLLSVDENSSESIAINVNYDGDAVTSHLISDDSDYLYSYIEDGEIKVVTQHIPWSGDEKVTLTLTSKAANQTITNTFSVVINNVVPDTISIEYQNISVVNENTETSLPFTVNYEGSGITSYGAVSSDTSLIIVTMKNGILSLTTSNSVPTSNVSVKITVNAVADGVVFTESFFVSVLSVITDELSLSSIGLSTLNEKSRTSIPFDTSYTGTGTVTYEAYLNNNQNAEVSLNNGILIINAGKLSGDNNQNLVAYIKATDGYITELLELPFTLINNAADVLRILEDDLNDVAESSTLSLPFPIEYDGERELVYQVQSNNPLLQVFVEQGILTITTSDVPYASDSDVNITLSASDGFIRDSHVFDFKIINNAPDTLELQLGDDIDINENLISEVVMTVNKTINTPITYTTTSSNEELISARIEDHILYLTSYDKVGRNNEDVEITVNALQGSLESSDSFIVTLNNNIEDSLEFNVDSKIKLAENATILSNTSLTYSGKDNVTYSIITKNAFVTASLSQDILTVNSNNVSGIGNVSDVITIIATDGYVSDTQKINVEVVNNESDELTIDLTSPSTINENSTTEIPVTINYSGDLPLLSELEVSDSNLASVTFENNIINISTNDVIGRTNESLTITLLFTDGVVSYNKSFSLLVNDTTEITLTTDIEALGEMSESSEERLLISTNYNGYSQLKYSLSNENAALSASLDGNYIVVNSSSINGTIKESVSLTLTVTDGTLSTDTTISFSILNDTLNTIGITSIDSLVVDENESGSIPFTLSYSDIFTLVETVTSNNNNMSVSLLDGKIEWTTEDVNSMTNVVITLSVTDGTVTTEHDILITINDNSLALDIANLNTLNEAIVHQLSFSLSYSGTDKITYTATSNDNSVATASINSETKKLIITTKDIKGASFREVTLTITATDGVITGSDSVTFSVVNSNINTLSINEISDVNMTDNSYISRSVTVNYSDDYPLTYSATSSDKTVLTATFNGTSLVLNSVELTSDESVTVTITATDGAITATKTIAVVVNDDDLILNIDTSVDSEISESNSSDYNITANYNGVNTLSYSVSSSNTSAATAAISDRTLTIITHAISGSVSEVVTLNITVTDGSTSDTISVTFNVLNDAINTISITGASDDTLNENSAKTSSITVSYSDTNPLTYSITSSNTSALDVLFDGSMMTLTTKEVTSDTDVNVTLTVTDGIVTASKTILINVKDTIANTLSFDLTPLTTIEESSTDTISISISYTGSDVLTKTVSFSNAFASGSISGSTLTVNSADQTGGETQEVTIEVTVTDGTLTEVKSFSLTINNTSYSATVDSIKTKQLLAGGLPSYSESLTMLNFLSDKGYLDQNLDTDTYNALLTSIETNLAASWVDLQAEAEVVTGYSYGGKTEAEIDLTLINWELVVESYISTVKTLLLDLNSNGVNFVDSNSIDNLYSNGTKSSLFHFNTNLGSFSGATWNYNNSNAFIAEIIPSDALCYTSP